MRVEVESNHIDSSVKDIPSHKRIRQAGATNNSEIPNSLRSNVAMLYNVLEYM